MTYAEELMQVLTGIDCGAIPLKHVHGERFSNTQIVFEAAGWKICVFDDAGEWDYLEYVESPYGVRREFPVSDNADEVDDILENWKPTDFERWGYPKDGGG